MSIRPSIYIGLGGTGITAISRAKKMYEEAFGKGKIPQQIAFAAIDFDLAMENNPALATEMYDDFLQIHNVASPRNLYEVRSQMGEYAWLFPGNARFLPDSISDGASQVRTTGRFLTEMIIASIDRRIAECWQQVTNIEGDESTITVEKTQKVDIHIAMSLAGGTGCGSFLNVAQLIRDKYQNKANIIGYGVIHGVFRTMDPSTNKSPRVVANAYSAILDLDYLMTATPGNPIELTINGGKKTLTQPIFNQFYVIENETENGKRVDNVKKLCEVVGTCLYAAGSELGSKIISGNSNTNWENGNFDISPKRGWVQALGACQVVYKGELLAEIYGYKAAVEIIRRLLQQTADIQQTAINWTEEVGIREDGDQYNMLIDRVYAPGKIAAVKAPRLDVRDTMAETKSAVNKYLSTFTEYPSDTDVKNICGGLADKLKAKVYAMLAGEGGVSNTLEFLETLEKLCTKYKGEMESERSVFERRCADLLSAVETKGYKEYEDYSKRFISTRKGKEERLEDLIVRPAQKIMKEKLEAKRRESSYNVFAVLLGEIGTLKGHVGEIQRKLVNLLDLYNDRLVTCQNTSESSLVFEYDLSYNERLRMTLDSKDVVMADFTRSLEAPLYEMELAEGLELAIEKFVKGLPQAQAYRDKLIVDVIKELPDEDYKRLKKEIAEKSSRLLKLEDRGQMSKTRGNALPTTMLVQNYLISIYGKDENGAPIKSRLENDRDFLRDIKKEYEASDFDMMRQKIIFYRSDMAIIPYCISSFDEMTVDREYETLLADAKQSDSSFNPHFDKQMFDAMCEKDFKLKPEIQNEAMLYWVCGALFGWTKVRENKYIMLKDNNGIPTKIESKEEIEHSKYIRVNKGKYYYWNEDGDSMGLNGKWVSFNDIAQRDRAFVFFKTVILPQCKQTLKNKILEDIKAMGKDYYTNCIEDLIAGGKFDYIDQVVCTDKNSVTYYTQAKGEERMFDEEWKYIEKNLMNALNNL